MTPRYIFAGLFALTLLTHPRGAVAQTESEVTASRLKGVEYLKSRQSKDGSWEFKSHPVGITALCTIALIENGVPLTDAHVQGGYNYVKDNSSNLKSTYDLALAVVLLSRIGDRRDKPRIRLLAARLVAGQNETGGWTYTCPQVDTEVLESPAKLPRPKEGFGDNSCTQFAVLGLWVASRTGLNIDRTLAVVARRFIATQHEDGGWGYAAEKKTDVAAPAAGADAAAAAAAAAANKPPVATKPAAGATKPGDGKEAPKANIPETTPTGASMTGAGLFCLAVAEATRIRNVRKAEKRSETTTPATTSETKEEEAQTATSLLENPIFARGFKRTGDFVKGIGQGSPRYFMWSVERVGVLLGVEEMGGVNWFQRGSSALIKSQLETGGWPTAWPETDMDGLSDTAFAVLFLRKANLGSDISQLLEGEQAQKFQIVGRKTANRFDTLEQAIADAKPGESIRVDGDGPFKVGHLDLSKDLTIQAGFGYAPVFKFELGSSRLGIKRRPETDPDARSMINIAGGAVTLEGLRLQFDPPQTRQPVPWVSVDVKSGSLRMLNCAVTDTNPKGGITGIRMQSPGTLIIRNSMFVGGAAAIEVVANGKQNLIVDNSIIFSLAAINLHNDEKSKKPADVTLNFQNSSIQVKEVLQTPKLTGKVDVNSHLTVYQADALGMSFLPSATSAQGRTWRGKLNVYDVKQWIGSGGKPVAAVTDIKSWEKFWGDKDKPSFQRIASFLGIRQVGNFSHDAYAQDWQCDMTRGLDAELQRNSVGINAYFTGPGNTFHQYRETIGYTDWIKGQLDLPDIEDPSAAKAKAAFRRLLVPAPVSVAASGSRAELLNLATP